MKNKFYDIPQLRQKVGIFQNRRHAGQVLAEMLYEWQDSKAMVLAVPSGGMPVAVEVAGTLDLSLDVAVVSKILLPWNTEAGFGAVGFDGSVWINQEYVGLLQTGSADHRATNGGSSEKSTATGQALSW